MVAVDHPHFFEPSLRSGLSRRPAVYETAALPLSYGGEKLAADERVGVLEHRVIDEIEVRRVALEHDDPVANLADLAV